MNISPFVSPSHSVTPSKHIITAKWNKENSFGAHSDSASLGILDIKYTLLEIVSVVVHRNARLTLLKHCANLVHIYNYERWLVINNTL